MAFLWVKQSRDLVQPPVHHKPILLNRWAPQVKQKEGFQSSSGSGSGSRSGSAPAITPPASQIDLPLELQAIYGQWEITPQDNYYDEYEQKELDALLIQASKFKSIMPPTPAPLIFGSSIGAFDAGPTTIPWDKDNEIYQQKDVVWGEVSQQASRSIFLKTYINEIAANLPNLPQCSPTDTVNYCYYAPMLRVETRDDRVAAGLQISEALIQAVGSLPMMYAQIDMNFGNFRELAVSRYNMFATYLGADPIPMEAIDTNLTQVGAALDAAVGKPASAALEAQKLSITAQMKAVAADVAKGIKESYAKIQAALAGITIANVIASSRKGAAKAGAFTLTGLVTTLDLLFGVLGAICMAVEGIITPIYQAMYKTQGVCPDGYREITEIVDPPTLTFLQNFIPLASFIVTFNPYVCWRTDDKGITTVRLKIPPKMPAFMSDRTLSLVYHAQWQSGSSPNIPIASSVDIELDPLPPGYVWLSNSDLAGSPDANEITAFAKRYADSVKGSTSYTGGTASGSKVSAYIAVKLCDPDTTPSTDGKQCLQKRLESTQAIPSKTQCAAGKFDDGYNCWNGQYDTSCINQFQYETVAQWDDTTGYFRVKETTCPTTPTSPTIATAYASRLTCQTGYELQGLICYKQCPTGYTREGASCKGRTNTYEREYMYGRHSMYVTQQFDVKILNDLSDVKVPYCDFSSSVMLNKMAQFYYSNSLLHPQLNEDGTIQIQMITLFKGVIASSELSCDVACRIEFINYDPITGGKYSVKVGCSYGDEDPEFKGLTFCYRRFYFIRVGNEPQGEFTVTGCTFVDYTAPDAKTLSYSTTTNPVLSVGPADAKGKTKTFDLIQKDNVSIIDWERYHREVDSGKVAKLAALGAFEAGVSIAASIYGAKGVLWGVQKYAARSAAQAGAKTLTNTVLRGAVGGADTGVTTAQQTITGQVTAAQAEAIVAARGMVSGRVAPPRVPGRGGGPPPPAPAPIGAAAPAPIGATPPAVPPAVPPGVTTVAPVVSGEAATGVKVLTEKEAIEISQSVTTAIQTATSKAAKDVAEEGLDPSTVDAAIRSAAREKAIAEGLSEEVAERLVSQLMKDMRWPIASMIGATVGGIVGGVGAGLAFSLKLREVLERTAGGAIAPAYFDSLPGTHVVGTTPDTLNVMTNQNWWKVNHGSIYELADGFTPTVNPCQITSRGDKVQVSSAYCRNKYIVRNMVNMYHNTYQNAHIREITAIEPRGTSGCYYKWNEVTYNAATNTEGTVLVAKEMILTNAIKDLMTCTYKPTGLTDDIKNPAYSVRQYKDPGVKTPRMIYPTRTSVYTSDIYARYVRLRPAASSPRVLTLAQIGVFDVSGFNVSTGMTTFVSGTGVDGGIEPKEVVSGSLTMGETEASVWQSSDTTSYWQVDLGKATNIAELVYMGGAFPEAAGRNRGVRIEFLYTDGPTDAPITTYTLPTDDSTQVVNMYSSVYTTPIYPLGGPLKIPRPIEPDTLLALERGCTNKCQDRSVIDSLVANYNSLNTSSSIVKVLRATTPTTTSCEYEAEVLTTDVMGGSKTRNSLTKQILSIQVNPEVTKISGCVLARYVKITPSFTPGTVLEFSKILVRNVIRDSAGTRPNVYVSRDATNIRYNMFYQLEEIAMSQPNAETYLKFLTDERSKEPAEYPKIFRAASNNPSTFFILDLNPPSVSHTCDPTITGNNRDIYDIQFVGAKDRTRGGIKGITIELYRDQPEETDAFKAFDGWSYDPVFRYILPTDDVNPPPIIVAPPAKCKFTTTLDGIKVLKKPSFLQANTPPLSEPDTSGGVFGFSSVLNGLGSAWNAIMPINPETLASTVKENTKKSNEIVETIHETLSATKNLLDTTTNCKNPEVLKRMTLLYNIKKGGTDTKTFGHEKDTMTRILKSGQSTPSTCDILFENVNEYYENYTVDTKEREKTVKTARFTFKKVGATVVPDPSSIVYDISENALGLMVDGAALSPVYSGAYSSVNCRDPALIGQIKTAVFRAPFVDPTGKTKVETQFKRVIQSFQTTPLCCEYVVQKLEKYTNIKTNLSVVSMPIKTFIKAIFSIAADGYTPLFSSAKEYDPNNMSVSSDGKPLLGDKVTDFPSIVYYDPSKATTTRVNTSTQNI